jgi:hypothetical protein
MPKIIYGQNKVIIRNNSKYSNILLTILITTMLFVSVDSIVFGTNASSLAQTIRKYMPIVLMVGLGFKALFQRKHIKMYLVFGILICIFIMINLLVAPGQNSVNNYISQIVLICVAMLVVINYSFESYIDSFGKIMYIVTLGSLIVYIIALLVPMTIKQFPIITNTSGLNYYWAIVAAVPEYGLHNTYWLRNTGLFREPGVFQIFLNLALAFHLFCSNRANIKKVIIYVVAIITTTSTTGFIALALLFCAYLVYKNPNIKKNSVTWVLLVITIIVSILFYFGISDKLDYSLNKLSDITNPSTISRVGSIYANVDIWMDYPIFGIGASEIINEFPMRVMNQIGVYAVDNTNTILFMFACYGIFIGLIFFVGCWLMCRSLVKQRIVVNILFIFLFVIYSGENLWYSYTPYILMMYGFQRGCNGSYKSD